MPFVFTLYSDGGFSVNNKDSDQLLKIVSASQYFSKVIVTQQNIYDYLIRNNFCPKEKIEFIFGTDTPLEKFELEEKYHRKIIELYNFETQIVPRIKLLTEEISNSN